MSNVTRAAARRAATLVFLSIASAAYAVPEGDLQFVKLGEGFPDTFCVTGGSDVVIQTVVVGDDKLLYTKPPVVLPVFIVSGADGVCDTTKTGNDVQVLPVATGEPNRAIILSSGALGDTGICDNAYVVVGDDHALIAAGKSTPRQVGVKAGGDNVLQSSASGDDVATAAICPGGDGSVQSAASGDDELSMDARCKQLCGTTATACVLPGLNELLTTTPDPADLSVPYVSTGSDGVANSAALSGDVQAIAVGKGLQGTVCVDSGADGLADTSACGNAELDARREGNQNQAEDCDDGVGNSDVLPNACRTACNFPSCGDGEIDNDFGELCDDGNTINGDGCSKQCLPSTCGNGSLEDGETCDDGNTTPCDGCSAACRDDACGDGEVCPPEACDDGQETATCDDDCSVVECGDENVNESAGEDCDEASSGNDGPCLSTCKFAKCSDGYLCDDPGCTSGPNGGPEECDDGDKSNRNDCVKDCALATCGDLFVRKEPVSVEDCDPPDDDAECVVGAVGASCENNADCNAPGINGLCDIKCDANCQDVGGSTCHDGNVDPGEDCDDGNHSDRDDCSNLCRTARCGDGLVHDLGNGSEECDDGNLVSHDGCNERCERECGNGVVDGHCTNGAPALIDAGCGSNTDCGESTLGAADGICNSDEFCDVGCGRGLVGGSCIAGTVGATCANNSDCNSPSPGSNDGRCQGADCGVGCAGLVGGTCTAGLVTLGCATNADCDTDEGLGNGRCVGSGCGPVGLGDLFCNDDGSGIVCSEECDIPYCGNALTECTEECDEGLANGVPGSGCDASCMRTLVGRYEIGASPRTSRECPTAWLYETRGATVELEKARFTCKDNDSQCDWDTMPDQCTFRVGVCLNRPGVGTCSAEPGGIVAWEIRGLKVAKDGNRHDAAAERITSAVAELVAADNPRVTVEKPGRCVRGLRAKTCSVGKNYECDPTFGAGVGVCDITTGVLFFPMLYPARANGCLTGKVGESCDTNADCGEDDAGNDGICMPGDQAEACTEPLSIEVNAGDAMKLRAKARRARGSSDTDRIQLNCQK